MGPTLVFSQLQVLLSHLWELKERGGADEGEKKIYRGREIRSRTRKKEREEEGVKRKKNN